MQLQKWSGLGFPEYVILCLVFILVGFCFKLVGVSGHDSKDAHFKTTVVFMDLWNVLLVECEFGC